MTGRSVAGHAWVYVFVYAAGVDGGHFGLKLVRVQSWTVYVSQTFFYETSPIVDEILCRLIKGLATQIQICVCAPCVQYWLQQKLLALGGASASPAFCFCLLLSINWLTLQFQDWRIHWHSLYLCRVYRSPPWTLRADLSNLNHSLKRGTTQSLVEW